MRTKDKAIVGMLVAVGIVAVLGAFASGCGGWEEDEQESIESVEPAWVSTGTPPAVEVAGRRLAPATRAELEGGIVDDEEQTAELAPRRRASGLQVQEQGGPLASGPRVQEQGGPLASGPRVQEQGGPLASGPRVQEQGGPLASGPQVSVAGGRLPLDQGVRVGLERPLPLKDDATRIADDRLPLANDRRPEIVDYRCGLGLVECNGECVSLLWDPEHCGACGNTCASGMCYKGHCGFELPPPRLQLENPAERFPARPPFHSIEK